VELGPVAGQDVVTNLYTVVVVVMMIMMMMMRRRRRKRMMMMKMNCHSEDRQTYWPRQSAHICFVCWLSNLCGTLLCVLKGGRS
jgi:hypothetical protein